MRLVPLVLVLFALPARAVDHTENVFGLGLTVASLSPGGLVMPAQLSARIAIQPRIEGSVLFGARFSSGASAFSPGIKGHFILLPEKRLNLYAAVGVGADITSGGGLETLSFSAGPGVELFLEGLPNLGLFLEYGFWGEIRTAGAKAGAESTYLATGIGSAGLHYWF